MSLVCEKIFSKDFSVKAVLKRIPRNSSKIIHKIEAFPEDHSQKTIHKPFDTILTPRDVTFTPHHAPLSLFTHEL